MRVNSGIIAFLITEQKQKNSNHVAVLDVPTDTLPLCHILFPICVWVTHFFFSEVSLAFIHRHFTVSGVIHPSWYSPLHRKSRFIGFGLGPKKVHKYGRMTIFWPSPCHSVPSRESNPGGLRKRGAMYTTTQRCASRGRAEVGY